MSFDSLAGLVIDACIDTLGSDAMYIPVIGAARTIRVHKRRPDQIMGALNTDTRHRHNGAVLEVRVSDLTVLPEVGDEVETDGERYRVRSAKPSESVGLVWVLDCVPDAR